MSEKIFVSNHVSDKQLFMGEVPTIDLNCVHKSELGKPRGIPDVYLLFSGDINERLSVRLVGSLELYDGCHVSFDKIIKSDKEFDQYLQNTVDMLPIRFIKSISIDETLSQYEKYISILDSPTFKPL